jgi:serine O-acetyltransferase
MVAGHAFCCMETQLSKAVDFASDVRDFIESDTGAALRADIVSWARWRNLPCKTKDDVWDAFRVTFGTFGEFRSIADYRFRIAGVFQVARIHPKLARRVELHIHSPSIGGGLRIQHGHSTWINAASVGRNMLIRQNVTIGAHKGGLPTIGDNVQIGPGAVIIGDVRIGNNVAIGGNVFINFDIEDDCVVFQAMPTIKKRASAVQAAAAE